MAADNLISFDELRARLAELDGTRMLAERELETLRNHEEHIGGLEAARRPAGFAGKRCAGCLGLLTPEERHHLYKLLKLRVTTGPAGLLVASGVFGYSFAITASLSVILDSTGQPFQAAQHQAWTPGQRFGRIFEPQIGPPVQQCVDGDLPFHPG
jgi:hypothetical protein